MLEPDGTTRYISPSVEKVLGVQPEELMGGGYGDRIHTDDLQSARDHFANALAGARPAVLVVRVRHADGHWVSLEGTTSVIRDAAGEPASLVTVSRPIPAALRAAGA